MAQVGDFYEEDEPIEKLMEIYNRNTGENEEENNNNRGGGYLGRSSTLIQQEIVEHVIKKILLSSKTDHAIPSNSCLWSIDDNYLNCSIDILCRVLAEKLLNMYWLIPRAAVEG